MSDSEISFPSAMQTAKKKKKKGPLERPHGSGEITSPNLKNFANNAK